MDEGLLANTTAPDCIEIPTFGYDYCTYGMSSYENGASSLGVGSSGSDIGSAAAMYHYLMLATNAVLCAAAALFAGV
jgi:hypothetical protein